MNQRRETMWEGIAPNLVLCLLIFIAAVTFYLLFPPNR